MRDPVREMLATHLEGALGRPVDLMELTDDTALASLGLDSILTINTLVTLSEDCDVDLAEYAELDPPCALGDLLEITARFMEQN